MAKPVGLVGVGAMGQALLDRLRRAGREVRAYDPAERGRQAAQAGGAALAGSAAEAAAGAEFVHVFVASDRQVLDATLGPAGVLAGASAGALVLLHSTTLPETTRRVAAEAAARGIDLLDAPITSIPRKVLAGEAVFLVGGPPDLVATARPHLLSLGRTVHHFGPLGSGNFAKLAKNLTNAVERVMLLEAVRLAEAGGLDARQFLEMMRGIDGGSAVSRWEQMFTIEEGRAVTRPATNLFDKDIQLAEQLAAACGLAAPVTSGAAATAREWVAEWAARRAQESKP